MAYNYRVITKGKIDKADLRAFALPRGSVRGLLAIFAMGSYVVFLFFGYSFILDTFTITTGKELCDNSNQVNCIKVDDVSKLYNDIITAASTLVAAVLGFYFGSRTATPLPSEEAEVSTTNGDDKRKQQQ